MATHKYGSFVARSLLSVLAGRDVAPTGKPKAAGGGGSAQHGKVGARKLPREWAAIFPRFPQL